MSNNLHSNLSADKKQREYQLIEQFLQTCHDFDGYHFVRFDENPDMIYSNGTKEIGFDSVIISPDQATIDCYFDAAMCQINLPTKLEGKERTDKIAVFFENKLFKHWRRYSIPTVLVFSLLDTQPPTLNELLDIASRFRLPEFELYNISDYYLSDGKRFVKIVETNQTK